MPLFHAHTESYAPEGASSYGETGSNTSLANDAASRYEAEQARAAGVDAEALSSLAEAASAPKLTRAERRRAQREYKAAMKQAERERREALRAQKALERRRDRAVLSMLRGHREKTLWQRFKASRAARGTSKDVYGSIGFELMYRDGICEVEPGLFSECLRFDDVSYQSAREDMQLAMMKVLSQLNDSFGDDVMAQYLICNTPLTEDEAGHQVFYDEAVAGANADYAKTMNAILNRKVLEGSSNIRREHYLCYAVEADDRDKAISALAKVRRAAQGFLGSDAIQSRTKVLNGHDRLALISSLLRPGVPFDFDYDRDLSASSVLTAKDFVCPQTMDFKPQGASDSAFLLDGIWGRVLIIRPEFAGRIDDKAVTEVLDLPIPMAITWHLHQWDQTEALTEVGRRASNLQGEAYDRQKDAYRAGSDPTMLPVKLAQRLNENDWVYSMLRDQNQSYFDFAGCIYTYAESLEALDSQTNEIRKRAHSKGIEVETYSLRQREGMNSVLPLANSHLDVVRDLLTCQASMLVPFTTQELDMEGGGYYGQNRLSGNLVLVNRKELSYRHGFVSGTSGSGKSFICKQEMLNTRLLYPEDEIYKIDPAGEYSYPTDMAGGRVYDFGPDTTSFLNPFDLILTRDQSFMAGVAGKTDAFIAMAAALKAEGGQTLSQEERSVLAAVTDRVYRAKLKEDLSGVQPILGDFVDELQRLAASDELGSAEAKGLVLLFGRLVSGPLSYLNHHSTVPFGQDKDVNFDLNLVPEDIRVFTILAVLETVRQRMFINYERGVTTWLYVDEIQSLFGHPAVLAYLARLWRESRKFGLICTGMTQSAADMAESDEAKAILQMSGFYLLMRQSDEDWQYWAAVKGLSEQELSYIGQGCQPGEGLLIADAARVPFFGDFPTDNRVYDMFSTDPNDVARRNSRARQAERERMAAAQAEEPRGQSPEPEPMPSPAAVTAENIDAPQLDLHTEPAPSVAPADPPAASNPAATKPQRKGLLRKTRKG